MFSIFSKRREAPVLGPSPERLAISFREFAPARILWRDASTAKILEFDIRIFGMKSFRDHSDAELVVDAHGVRVGAMVDSQSEKLTVYLGNYFWVADDLKRKGLGIALIAAIVEVFELAAFGSTSSKRPVFLEGFFVNEGALFATAVCSGVTPTKAVPAEIHPERLQTARKAIRLVMGPTQTFSSR